MDLGKVHGALWRWALALPEAYDEEPWGERVAKVKGKIFLFLSLREERLQLTVKLPTSGAALVKKKLGEPTGYGLGKSGWVTLKLPRSTVLTAAQLEAWILESFRAIAPKRVAAALDAASTKKTAPKAQSKARRAPKLATRLFLVCADPLRGRRAVEALAARGAICTVVATASAMRGQLERADAVIIDVGRAAEAGLTLAAEIDASDWPILLFLVGVRGADMERRARADAAAADLYREAISANSDAGDASAPVADAIVATLRRYDKA